MNDNLDDNSRDSEEDPFLEPDEIDIIEDDDEIAAGSKPEFARLGNNEFLILGGPGAGSVVQAPPAGSELAQIATIPSRDDALDGSMPLLIVHRPAHGAATIPPLLAQLHAIGSGRMSLGATVPIPQVSLPTRQTWLGDCTTASVRIADPHCYLLDGGSVRLKQDPIGKRAPRYAPYLSSVGAPDWVAQVLEVQRDSGANLLLTSGRALDGSDPQQSLDNACAEGDDALAELKPGERLALNLTITSEWLSNTRLRDMLISQLIDQEQFDTWYVRVQWKNVRAHAQPGDAGVMEGYRALATVAEDEERKLLLPQTGLTGWSLIAFGALGFGAGISGSLNQFGEPTGGRGDVPRIERYFERKLLHTVERTTHDRLRGMPDYVPCACRYCGVLPASGTWNHQAAALHYLTNLGELTANAGGSTSRGGPRGSIRRTVRSALRYATGKPLAGPDAPSHLQAWDRSLT